MVRPVRADKLTVVDEVVESGVEVMWDPGRWAQAPSSVGTGREEGRGWSVSISA